MRKYIIRAVRSFLSKRNKALISCMEALGRPRYVDVMQNIYTNEYVRLSQLDLAIDEIIMNNVKGDVAEVGVYKGYFSAVLNTGFPDRNLYLFDTFEGFEPSEELHDREKHGLTYKYDYSDTSVEAVMSLMPNPQKCIIRKGFFPATASGLEDNRFCFVSLDTDLYEPVANGLQFFYERLIPGGFIFVHDYNNNLYPGVKKAVQEFSVLRKVNFCPVTDVYGTAIFRR